MYDEGRRIEGHRGFYTYFVSIVFIANRMIHPPRIEIRVQPPVLMQMSYGRRPFGARTHVAAVAERSTGRYRRKPLSQFVPVVRCATSLNAACHLFDPSFSLPPALMPLLSPSSAPRHLLNCITYSPGIRINVWREGKRGRRGKEGCSRFLDFSPAERGRRTRKIDRNR